jgi:hypothetical protein
MVNVFDHSSAWAKETNANSSNSNFAVRVMAAPQTHDYSRLMNVDTQFL